MVATMADLDRATDSVRERWFLWIPVAFGVGIGGYFSLPDEPPIWLGVVLAIAVAGIASLVSRIPFSRRRLAAAGLAFFCIAALGFTAAQWRTQSVAAPVLEKRTGPVQVAGRVDSLETFADGFRVPLAEPRASPHWRCTARRPACAFACAAISPPYCRATGSNFAPF